MAWRVVIGYDGSDAAEDAVAFGLTWCRSTGDVPVVATVYPEEHPLGAGRVDAEWAAYVRELGQETLDKARAVAGDAAIYRLVASTSAARGLADLAEDVDAAAVLVGGSRKDEGGGGRLGSVANRLLYGATVPVCVVPEAWQAPDGGVISKIGVAFLDTKDGHEALACRGPRGQPDPSSTGVVQRYGPFDGALLLHRGPPGRAGVLRRCPCFVHSGAGLRGRRGAAAARAGDGRSRG